MEPLFRHLFGADLHEVMSWDVDRYERHLHYAKAYLKMMGGRGGY